jgi:Fe-S cluster assembly scaffold protein SufB
MSEQTPPLDQSQQLAEIKQDYDEKYGFHVSEASYAFKGQKGLSRDVVAAISEMKGEPQWMRDFRLRSLEIFYRKPMPTWGGDLSGINFDDIYYYVRATDRQQRSWDEVPEDIKYTFDRLGIPEAEQKFLAGAGAQFESEVVYHSIRKDLEEKGVIFLDTDGALRDYPDLFREYWATVIPPTDNKFAALNSAVWSGGSFIYVPKGVHVDMPLQAYFRINTNNMGQFERTLIIVDEGASVHYVEGCTAPTYSSDSLHSAVVEIIVKKGGRARYTTIQNWSNNVYNLVTKRAVAYQDAVMEWVDCNIGCLAEGSTVTTPEGVKPIEQVNVGDLVLSWDEQNETLCFRKVLAKRFSGNQPVHEVSAGARKLRVTANHPFYTYLYDAKAPKESEQYRLGYVRADHLKKTLVPLTSLDYGVPYRLKLPKLLTAFESSNQSDDSLTMAGVPEPRLRMPEYTTDDLMWMFGYWLGDGNLEIKLAKTRNAIRFAKVGFSAPRTDRARQRLVGTMNALIEAEPTERAEGVHLAWRSKELAEFFLLNGFEGKARKKHVPQWVYSLPESQRLAFVAGYLEADGTVISSKRRYSWKSSNRALLQEVADLLTTLGIPTRLYTEFDQPREVMVMGNRVTAHGAYRLEAPFDPRLLPYVSATLREKVARSPIKAPLKRKIGRSNIELSPNLDIAAVAVSAASEALVPTWDIEVEGTGNFVSQGFIVHNSKLTMKYPAVYLMESGAHGEVLSVAFAGKGQTQDAGGKIVHVAPHTSSQIISKSISMHGGRSSYRGLLKVNEGAEGSKSNVVCDALLMDETSRTDTYPSIEIDEQDVTIGHEASVSKVNEEQVFYMMSRGISEDTANAMIVSGFIEPIAKELPAEYSIELYRLVQLQMEGSVG